ncbi:ADP-ribosyl cyclase/cyclic ADP-ribose hydrolase 1-like isoform X3 [Mugil cephalus]|uniref:ADP-ribosyl cyclase/cyclic ADP-ribose hydrolase 1-like isoform X3 n=1 Tax=Mugil cephalus TaxID=48193 RepID=UPI001FB6AFEA|nr:ADP-ribosyl cyclase/cyclic ADP-ribose hydrolase 1-like isoform X3 [Mugil cephalus]
MDRKRRRLCLLASLLVVLLIIILGVVLGLTLNRDRDPLKRTFLDRCGKFKEYDCQNVWSIFEQAYVNKDPCNVPPEAYHPLIAAAPIIPACNRMMFWSKTKDVVHDFTNKRDCFITMEDTLLGSVLDGLRWCGEEGSTETFTTDCPGWSDCVNNPVRSFWNSVSAAFAKAACGQVTTMLNGSIDTPYSPSSVFASIEVKNLNSTTVQKLNVVLVIQKNAVTNCTNASLENLKKDLGEIQYDCKEVPESQIQECASDPEKPCGSCW